MVLEKEKTLTKLSKSLEKLNESRDHIANLTRFSDRVGEDLRELRGKEARASSQLKVEAVAHRTAAARLKKEIQDIRRKLQNEAAKSEKAMQDADGAKLAEKKAKDDLQTLKKDMVKLRATAKKAEEALIEIRKEFMTVRIQKIDISKDANERKVELEKAQELINSKIEETAHLHALCAVRTKERDELLHEVQNSRNLTQELRKALAAVHKDMNHLQTREIATIKSRKDAERREYDANARANKLEQELRDIMIELNVISGEVANLTTTTTSSSLNAGNGKSHYKIQPSRTVPRTTMMTMETAGFERTTGDGEVELPPLVTEGGATRSPTQPRKFMYSAPPPLHQHPHYYDMYHLHAHRNQLPLQSPPNNNHHHCNQHQHSRRLLHHHQQRFLQDQRRPLSPPSSSSSPPPPSLLRKQQSQDPHHHHQLPHRQQRRTNLIPPAATNTNGYHQHHHNQYQHQHNQQIQENHDPYNHHHHHHHQDHFDDGLQHHPKHSMDPLPILPNHHHYHAFYTSALQEIQTSSPPLLNNNSSTSRIAYTPLMDSEDEGVEEWHMTNKRERGRGGGGGGFAAIIGGGGR